jgi:hypothetical protein
MRAMRLATAVAFALLLGCGPLIPVEVETDGDDADGSGKQDSTGGDPGSSTSTTTPGSTVGSDDSDSGNPNPTTPFDFGSGGECWQVQPLFEAPDHVSVIPTDQDNDGREEVWLLYDADGGGGPGETTIYAIDSTGAQLVEQIVDGFVLDIGDIEGDGLQDIVTLGFGMGNPVFGWWRANGPASFEAMPLTFDLEFEGSFVTGFFDATNDGRADAFRMAEGDILELLLGDGNGSFLIGASLPILPTEGFTVTAPVEDASGLTVLWSVPGFGDDGECLATYYMLLQTDGGEMFPIALSNDSTLGALQAAKTDETGSTVLYIDSCVPGVDTHDLRILLMQFGSGVFTELPGALGKSWATVGDFDGDSYPDLVFADVGGRAMSFSPGIGGNAFAEPVLTEVPLADTRNNNVRALDMDGDGRDELLRAVVIADGESAQLSYERIFLGPC